MSATPATDRCPPVAAAASSTDGFSSYLSTLTAAIAEHNANPRAFAAQATPLSQMFGGMDPAEALCPDQECTHEHLPSDLWLHPTCFCWDQPGTLDLTCERKRREGLKRLRRGAALAVPTDLPPNVVALPSRRELPGRRAIAGGPVSA